MNNRLNTIISSFFFLGNSPIAPGTAGTLGSIPLYYLMVTYMGGIQYMVFLLLLTALAIKVSSNAVRIYKREDPREVVIDEVVGFLVTMAFIAPTIINIVLGFLLFRALDILKPFPCRRLEKLHGGYGIVMDDVAAGVWANVLLVAINNILIK